MTSVAAKYISKRILGETAANKFGKEVGRMLVPFASTQLTTLIRILFSKLFQQRDSMADPRVKRQRRDVKLSPLAYQSTTERFLQRSNDEHTV